MIIASLTDVVVEALAQRRWLGLGAGVGESVAQHIRRVEPGYI